jgi:hypothetical protein
MKVKNHAISTLVLEFFCSSKFSCKQGCIYLILLPRGGMWGKNIKKVKRKEEKRRNKREKKKNGENFNKQDYFISLTCVRVTNLIM